MLRYVKVSKWLYIEVWVVKNRFDNYQFYILLNEFLYIYNVFKGESVQNENDGELRSIDRLGVGREKEFR